MPALFHSVATYAADDCVVYWPEPPEHAMPWRWKRDTLRGPFMPRDAARLFIRIREVGVERLHPIGYQDCIAEGMPGPIPEVRNWSGSAVIVRQQFCEHWNEINGADSWDSNPWVWVYKLERVEASDG